MVRRFGSPAACPCRALPHPSHDGEREYETADGRNRNDNFRVSQPATDSLVYEYERHSRDGQYYAESELYLPLWRGRSLPNAK